MSYSVYLWHWPAAVLAPQILGQDAGVLGQAVTVVTVLALSAASYELIEKPFQRSRRLQGGLWRAFAFAAAGMAVAVSLGTAAQTELRRQADANIARAQAQVQEISCHGGQALLNPACAEATDQPEEDLLPPEAAGEDVPGAYAAGCVRAEADPAPLVCEYGEVANPQARRVALWGNSHATQWLPALESLSASAAVRVDTYLARSCYPVAPGEAYLGMSGDPNCFNQTEIELAEIRRNPPDLMILSNWTIAPDVPEAAVLDSAEWVLTQLVEAGIPALVVRDTPRPAFNIPDCLAAAPADPAACDGARSDWLSPDPWLAAVERMDSPLVTALDLSGGICDADKCHARVGGVTVYRDDQHLTATFAESLAPQLEEAVTAALKR
jgi:hypothetical protein